MGKGDLTEDVKPLIRYEEMGSKVHVKGLNFDRERDTFFIVMGEEGGEFR